MSRLITGLILGGLFICYAWSCGDDYMTVERRIIDADNKVPVYFYAEAEQAGSNTWKPVFTYLIYSLEEGEYDAYFHAYMIDSSDSVLWSGIQPIQIEGGKRVWGQYVTDAEFYPYMIAEMLPMAYASVSYE
tara:strand:- start:65 stop:460 length:396 start_codon:yes stop_codon:yes gene_type:complete